MLSDPGDVKVQVGLRCEEPWEVGLAGVSGNPLGEGDLLLVLCRLVQVGYGDRLLVRLLFNLSSLSLLAPCLCRSHQFDCRSL